jgi:hypothetical protein
MLIIKGSLVYELMTSYDVLLLPTFDDGLDFDDDLCVNTCC